MKKNLNIIYYFCFFTVTLLLSACSTTTSTSTEISYSAKQYLVQANETQGPQSEHLEMLATRQLINDNNLNDATQLLAKINNATLDPMMQSQKMILEAELALKKNQPKLAVNKLHQIKNLKDLSLDTQITYYTDASTAFLRENNLAYSTLALISLNALLTDETTIQQNNVIIWHNLQTLSLSTLNQLLSRSNAPLLRGWIELAILAKQNATQTAQLIQAIEKWKTLYPNHVANTLLPENNILDNLLKKPLPVQVALLLPLHGEFGALGRAVQNGFMTAFYHEAKLSSYNPKIKIIDTSQSNDISAIYQQALDAGANFIVGPLIKDNVHQLASHSNIQVPTLSLNYLSDDMDVPNNMITFGLSPEQAAIQAAHQMWQHNITKIILIDEQNDWSDKVKKTFIDSWYALGGQVINELDFSSQDQLSDEIAATLNIDQSLARAKTLKNLLQEPIKLTPRRRQDIDGIFLLASPAQARQVVPLLRFYYAGNIPIFSISNIYAGFANTQKDQDLDGLYFNDMPWIIGNSPLTDMLKKQIQTLWSSGFQVNSRLYALGIDSYSLVLLFNRLLALPDFAIDGVTGKLYLENHSIARQLPWAQFRNGTPHLLNP